MNETNAPLPSSPLTPPPFPGEDAPSPTHVGACLELLLRNPSALVFHLRGDNGPTLISFLLVVAMVSLTLFGLVIGLFSGGTQLWAAPLKISLGLLISALICFPSLYIFTCLSGIEIRLSVLAGLLTGAVAMIGVLLLGFAPVTWVFSQSTESLPFFGFLNLTFFGIGLSFSLGFLQRSLSHKKSGNLVIWMGIFTLVCLQMTATLRPIIGTADTFFPTEKKFFLSHWGDSSEKRYSKDPQPD